MQKTESNTNFPFLIAMFGFFSIIVVLAIQNINAQAADLSLTDKINLKGKKYDIFVPLSAKRGNE